MAKGQNAETKKQILALLAKHRGAAMSLSEIGVMVRLPPQQVLTLLGQLKGEVECVSKATMESTASMKWQDVDSKWKIAGGAAKAPVKWPPRPGTAPFGSETKAQLEDKVAKGKLTREKLLLAAYLGHPAAREVLGAKSPEEVLDPAAWLLGLVKWKEEVRVRALAAAARKALAAFEAAVPGDDRPRRAAEAALAYGKSSGKDAAALGTGTALAAEESANRAPEGPARDAATAAFRLGILTASLEAHRHVNEVERIAGEIATALARALPDADLRAAVKDELGPWSLA